VQLVKSFLFSCSKDSSQQGSDWKQVKSFKRVGGGGSRYVTWVAQLLGLACSLSSVDSCLVDDLLQWCTTSRCDTLHERVERGWDRLFSAVVIGSMHRITKTPASLASSQLCPARSSHACYPTVGFTRHGQVAESRLPLRYLSTGRGHLAGTGHLG
jgi:hypothetical protein